MKRGYWIVGGVVLAALVVGAVVLLVGPSSEEEEHPATVIEAVNKVEAHPRPKEEWRPAIVDMLVYVGGQVRTGGASSAQLALREGTVRLSADSIFTVKKSTTRQEKLVTTVFLQEGRLWADLTSEQPHEFTVESGYAVAAVRDTRFSVRVTTEEMLVSVAEGEVVLTAQEQSVTVAAEEQATVAPGEPPSPPEPMREEERSLWATEGETPRLAPPTPTALPTPTPEPALGGGAWELNIDRPGMDFENFDLPEADPQLCQDACAEDERCQAWTYVKPNTIQGPNPRCWLKYDVPPPLETDCCVSGVKVNE